jgi:hypothetical protein
MAARHQEAAMFIECDVEVAIKDRTLSSFADHDLKLWLQRAFKANSCYRIANFKSAEGKVVTAQIAINDRVVAEPEWRQIETEPPNPALLQGFVEKLFEGKGTLRFLSKPTLKPY